MEVWGNTYVLHLHEGSYLDVSGRGASRRLLIGLGLLLARGDGVVVEMRTGAVGSQVGVVHSRVERDRSRGAHVLVCVFKNQTL